MMTEIPEALVEKAAREAFMSDDLAGHHRHNGSPFNYSPFTWESIPEVGRENYRRMVRDIFAVTADEIRAEAVDQFREQAAQAIEGAVMAHREHGHRQVVAAMAPLPQLVRDLGRTDA